MPLNVSVISWNLCERSPSERDYSLLLSRFIGMDLVIVGVQELEDIRPRRNPGRRSVRMIQLQQHVFGRQYERIAQHQMGGLQIAVFAKRKIAKLITGITTLEVPCGVGNVMTNKGAVSVAFTIKGRKVILINAHLAAHQTKVSILNPFPFTINHLDGQVSARNSDYRRIMDIIRSKLENPERSISSIFGVTEVFRIVIAKPFINEYLCRVPKREAKPSRRKRTLLLIV